MKRPKRKIEDLKPNECIHIKTEKEAKRISKLKGTKKFDIFRAFDTESINTAYFPTDNHTFGDVNDAIRFEWVVYPASDFLPKKKSKTAKRIDRIEKRLAAIEKEYDFVTSCNAMPAIEEKPFVLPEKWCVKLTEENKDDVGKYFLHGYEIGRYIHSPERDIFRDFNVVSEGYTEITTEQFIEYVLKREEQPDLRVGQWYRYNDGLFFLQKIDEVAYPAHLKEKYWEHHIPDVRKMVYCSKVLQNATEWKVKFA